MNLQRKSWVMMQDRQFHYQEDGKTLCGVRQMYALFEESKPPVKDCCKECTKLLEKQINGS